MAISRWSPTCRSVSNGIRPSSRRWLSASALQARIRECTYAFRYPPEMQKGFQGADRWLPIDYKKDWELVRRVAKESGQSFNRTAFDKEKARAEASKK